MESRLMKCGHRAQATTNGAPCCVICFPSPDSLVPVDTLPDLTGRKARCSCCNKTTVDSSVDLAFYEFRGPGTHYDSRVSNCLTTAKEGGFEYDNFYCGCYGWD